MAVSMPDQSADPQRRCHNLALLRPNGRAAAGAMRPEASGFEQHRDPRNNGQLRDRRRGGAAGRAGHQL
jgi:hypothetical protein